MAGGINTGVSILYTLFLAAGNTTPTPPPVSAAQPAHIRTKVPVQYVGGRYTPERLNAILAQNSALPAVTDRLEHMSRSLLGIPFKADTLVGSPDIPEQLVVNLEGVDCFTYLDYVVAGAESKNIPDFLNHLWKVRYHNNAVEYDTRNHFFTQWVEHNPQIDEVTSQVCSRVVRKTVVLNRKLNGERWVPAIPESKREVTYIPLEDIISGACNPQFLTGDFVGLVPHRSRELGMDARHVGMIVRDGDYLWLRHVSYQGKTREDDFRSYVTSHSGLFSGVIVARYHSP